MTSPPKRWAFPKSTSHQGSSCACVRVVDPSNLPAQVLVGQVVRLSICDDAGRHQSEVRVARTTHLPYPTVVVSRPMALHTRQNREYFRVPVTLVTTCAVVHSERPMRIGFSDTDARTRDLSAGGVRLATTLKLDVGDRILVTFAHPFGAPAGAGRSAPPPSRRGGPAPSRRDRASMPPSSAREHLVFALASEVVRVLSLAASPVARFSVGARFRDVTDRDQDRLVKLLFELQRRLTCEAGSA